MKDFSTKEQEILKQLTQKLEVDTAEIEHDLSIIMIVGEKMKSQVGVTATAAKALSENEINIQMISQGSSEVSIMFVVSKDKKKKPLKPYIMHFSQITKSIKAPFL